MKRKLLGLEALLNKTPPKLGPSARKRSRRLKHLMEINRPGKVGNVTYYGRGDTK